MKDGIQATKMKLVARWVEIEKALQDEGLEFHQAGRFQPCIPYAGEHSQGYESDVHHEADAAGAVCV